MGAGPRAEGCGVTADSQRRSVADHERIARAEKLASNDPASVPEAEAGVPNSAPTPPVVSGAHSLFRSCRQLRSELRGADFLIEGYAERNALAFMFGESDAYKTFAAIDMAMHIATGRNWHGHRVQQGAAFIIAGEGHSGIARRIDAWMKHYGITDDPPVYVSERAIMLDANGETERVAEDIEQLAKATSHAPAIIVIDTLSRNMAGDADQSDKAGRFIEEVTRHLALRFKALVLVVHHVGHGDKDRERGSYALRGAADARYIVRRDGELGATVEPLKMKDGPLPKPLRLDLVKVDLGIADNFGNPQSSLAVTSAKVTTIAKAKPKGGRKIKVEHRNLLTDIQSAVGSHGAVVDQEGVPRNLRVVSRETVREAHRRTFEAGEVSDDPAEAKKQDDKRRKELSRGLATLRAAGLIDYSEEYVWSVPVVRLAA